MSDTKKDAILWPEIIPHEGMREVKSGGATYLLRNDTMFTAVQHSQGEFSDFFLAIRDEGRIFGHRCPRCRHLIVPPFMKRCPPCNFVEMEKEYVQDIGVMAATPVITVFAPTRFKDQVPFATGRVFLSAEDGKPASTAMLVRVRTTLGTIRPGIFHKGTPVKLVFLRNRRGVMTELFALPQSELTEEQLAKSPLIEDEVEWGRVPETKQATATPESKAELQESVRLFRELGARISKSPRAKADLSNWRRSVRVETPAGAFRFVIDNGTIEVSEGTGAPDLVFRIADTKTLVGWLRSATELSKHPDSPPLTDLFVEGKLILSKPELETITRLDRVPRSLRRDA